MNSELIDQIGAQFGANGLPYPIPIHPNLVHLTLGLFIIGIAFDIAGALFPLERSILKFLSLTAVRSNFFDVGWYNVLASAIITFSRLLPDSTKLCWQSHLRISGAPGDCRQWRQCYGMV